MFFVCDVARKNMRDRHRPLTLPWARGPCCRARCGRRGPRAAWPAPARWASRPGCPCPSWRWTHSAWRSRGRRRRRCRRWWARSRRCSWRWWLCGSRAPPARRSSTASRSAALSRRAGWSARASRVRATWGARTGFRRPCRFLPGRWGTPRHRLLETSFRYLFFFFLFQYGVVFFLLDLFWICLSQNGSMNIEYDEIVNMYSDRINILVLESLYLS